EGDPFGLDVDLSGKKKKGAQGADGKKKKGEDGAEVSEVEGEGLNLDELLGNPAEDPEWQTGENAFEKITLDIKLKRNDAPGSPDLSDIALIERQENDLLLDAPALGYKLGEKFTFAVALGQSGQLKNLTLVGVLKSTEPADGSREIILVAIAELSKPHL